MINIASGPLKSGGATLDQPLEHLSACHRRIEQRLATIERAAPVLWECREEALRALRNAFAFLDTSGVHHTEDEETSLFPRLADKLTAEQAAFIASLEADHEAAEDLHRELRQIVERIKATPTPDDALAGEYSAAASRFCALYRAHIAQEDSRLAEIGRALLSEGDLAAISAEMKARRGL